MSQQIVKQTIPVFETEAQERAYWESHDSSAHLDWTQAQKVKLPNLRPTTKTISLRLPQHLLDSIKVAANARDVVLETLTVDVSERGATRMDDQTCEASREKRKKDGYF